MAAIASLALIPPLALWFGYQEFNKKDDGPWDPNRYSVKKVQTTHTTQQRRQPEQAMVAAPQHPQHPQHHHKNIEHHHPPKPSQVALCAQVDRYQVDRGHHSLHTNEYRPWDIPVVTDQPVMPGARSNMGYSLFNDNAYRRDFENDRMVAEGPFVNSMTGQVYQGYTMAPPPPTGDHHSLTNPRTLERLQGWGSLFEKPVRQDVNFRDPTMPEQRFLEGPNGIDTRKQVAMRSNRDISMNMNGFTACEGGVQPMPSKGQAAGYVGKQQMTRHTPFMPATMRQTNTPRWLPGVALLAQGEANAPRQHWEAQADRSAAGRTGSVFNGIGRSQATAQPNPNPEAPITNHVGAPYNPSQPGVINLAEFRSTLPQAKNEFATTSHVGLPTAETSAPGHRNQHDLQRDMKMSKKPQGLSGHMGAPNPLSRAPALLNQHAIQRDMKTSKKPQGLSGHMGSVAGATAPRHRATELSKVNQTAFEASAPVGGVVGTNAPRFRSITENTSQDRKEGHGVVPSRQPRGRGFDGNSNYMGNQERTNQDRKETQGNVGMPQNDRAADRPGQHHSTRVTTQHKEDIMTNPRLSIGKNTRPTDRVGRRQTSRKDA